MIRIKRNAPIPALRACAGLTRARLAAYALPNDH